MKTWKNNKISINIDDVSLVSSSTFTEKGRTYDRAVIVENNRDVLLIGDDVTNFNKARAERNYFLNMGINR